MTEPRQDCDCQNRANRRPLTVQQFCDELSISRSTFYEWRDKQRAPRCIKLPNGSIRIQRADYDSWISDHSEESTA